MPAFDNITDRQFGRWTVQGRDRGRKWLCRCDCGTEKPVDGSTLRNGHSTSCGCHRAECTRRRTTHGHARAGRVAPEWNIWSGIRQRCFNTNHKSYPRYGGRGITVCDRWLESFENFLADMGTRPSPKHTIERVDNDGPYSPTNCVWATRTVQARNTSQNRRITYDGRTLTLAAWAEEVKKDPETIAWRLDRGWSVRDALTRPLSR